MVHADNDADEYYFSKKMNGLYEYVEFSNTLVQQAFRLTRSVSSSLHYTVFKTEKADNSDSFLETVLDASP